MSREPGNNPDRRVFDLRSWALIAALHAAALVAATWPAARTFATRLPAAVDPVQHLTILRWYRHCLIEGRSPLLCHGLQYPVGAPLGNFSPLHIQALAFIPLRAVIDDDVLCYNILWFLAYLGTGLGTAYLIGTVLGDRLAAAVGGLLAMLSGPMMFHGLGHLELISLGAFPAFLAAWLRFVDEPKLSRLAASAALYVLLTMSAAYYAVLSLPAAALYVVWRALGSDRRANARRAAWLAAFLGVMAPGMVVLGSAQIWASRHGFALGRSRAEFEQFGAPLWGYAVPTILHRLDAIMPCNLYDAAGRGATAHETASYLGVVTLALIYYAALNRVRFPRAGYWWSAFGLLVLLSIGATGWIGGYRVPLPAGWLWDLGYPFRLIRVPARFNLLAAVVGALLAAAGLQHLLRRLRRPSARALAVAVLTAAAVFDLAIPPLGDRFPVRSVPPAYAWIARTAPGAAVVDAPMFPTGCSALIGATCGYWQSYHRLPTTAGYSGVPNAVFDDAILAGSPFQAAQLADPAYLADPESQTFDLAADAPARDYAWLYLTAQRLRFVVLHREAALVPELPVRRDRLEALLRPALVFEDDRTAVFDRVRLPRPDRPVLTCLDGWRRRGPWQGRPSAAPEREARLAVFEPDPARGLVLQLEAASARSSRTIVLRSGAHELARWTIRPGAWRSYSTRPLRLDPGLNTLTIQVQGAVGADGSPGVRVASWRLSRPAGQREPSRRVAELGFVPLHESDRRHSGGDPRSGSG